MGNFKGCVIPHGCSGKTKNDVSAIEQLEIYKMFMTHYTDHNCSITVHVKEDEWEKVEEEMIEFKREFNVESSTAINKQKAMAEFGDLLFALVNFARKAGINPDDALERTNLKFQNRFQFIEAEAT